MRLRIDSLLRDIYFSGVYSALLPEDRLIISEQLDALKQDNPNLFEDISLSAESSSKSAAKPSLSVEKEKEYHNISEVKCVFCNVDKISQKDTKFYIHPYVPKNYRSKCIYMCSSCIESWQVYRQTAQEENTLMVPGETNEEICAICSDSPEVQC